jgi:hypothetical protein
MTKKQSLKRIVRSLLSDFFRPEKVRTLPESQDPVWYPHYDENVPREIVLPDTTLDRMFVDVVKRRGSEPALNYFGRTLTFQELYDQVAR